MVFSLLGTIGLIISASKFIRGGGGAHSTKEIITYGILGLVFFLAGIGLIKTTRDKAS